MEETWREFGCCRVIVLVRGLFHSAGVVAEDRALIELMIDCVQGRAYSLVAE